MAFCIRVRGPSWIQDFDPDPKITNSTGGDSDNVSENATRGTHLCCMQLRTRHGVRQVTTERRRLLLLLLLLLLWTRCDNRWRCELTRHGR